MELRRLGTRFTNKIVERKAGCTLLYTTQEDTGFVTWQVRGPTRLGTEAHSKLCYWAHPDEATARRFFERLVTTLDKQGKESA
jgi:hypothetical protein